MPWGPIPLPAKIAAPQPPKTSQKVPKNSAARRRLLGCMVVLLPERLRGSIVAERRPRWRHPDLERSRASRPPVRRTRDVRPSPGDARPLCPRPVAARVVGGTDDEEQGDGRGIDYPGSGGL